MEQKRGPLLYALCQYDNLVLFPINPRTVANYRKAFQPSRAKSDPVDARLLVELMQKHPEKLELWAASCPKTRALRQWVESRRMLVGEKVRLTNRITASLKAYFPQVLDWFEDKDTGVFCEFIEQFSEVQTAQAATPEPLIQFFHAHKVTRKSAINRRIQQIQAAGPPLTTDEAIVVPAQALTRVLIALLKVILSSNWLTSMPKSPHYLRLSPMLSYSLAYQGQVLIWLPVSSSLLVQNASVFLQHKPS